MTILNDLIFRKGAIVVKVEGLKDIVSRLDQMRDDLQRRLLIDVMKKSLMLAMVEAESRVPTGPVVQRTNRKSGGRFSNIPGVLKRSFRLKKMRSSNPYVLEVQLQNTAYYALWVELGHRIVKGKKGARRVVGHTRPNPYMRATFENQKEGIMLRISEYIKVGLQNRGL